VTNRAVLESELAPRITECAHVADYKTGVHACSFGSQGELRKWHEHATSPGIRFPPAKFVDEAYLI
jgi:hypothetical protein